MTPDRAAGLQSAVGVAPGTFPERLATTGPDARALYRALLAPLRRHRQPSPGRRRRRQGRARTRPGLCRAG